MDIFPLLRSPFSTGAAVCFLGLLSPLPGQGDASPSVSVEALVQHVLATNPEANFYRAEIAAARGEARTAAILRNPEFAAELGHKRVRSGAGAPAGDGAAWSVSVQQTFDYPGRVSLRKAIAARQIELAEIGYAQFQATLAARARSLAHDIHSAQERAEAAHEVADRMQALQEVLVQRDPAGLNPVLETRILEANALTLGRRASQADVARRAALIELNQLRGLPLDASLRVASSDWQFLPVPANAELVAAARRHAFELRMREAELAQQGFKVSLARNERHGNITVAPFISAEEAGDRERKIGVGVSLPLPLWNQQAGAVDTAKARLEQAELSVRIIQRQIEQQVVTSAGEYAIKLVEIGRWRPEAAEQFRAAAAEADRHYRLGAVPLATYVELQKQYLEATEALGETRREAFAAGQRLELLTGVKLCLIRAPQATPTAEPKP